MMDADVQVWLDAATETRPGMIVPYVVSEQPRDFRYRLRAVQDGSGGRAIIGQTGAVRLSANVPAALSTIALSRSPRDRCEIEVVLTEVGLPERRYVFQCPS